MSNSPERKFYLKQFKAICYAISTYDDFNLLANHLVEGVALTFKAKGASLMVLDETENQLFRVCSYGISEEYLGKGPVFADRNDLALYTGKPELVKDFRKDPSVQYPDAAAREGIVSMLSIPIKSRTTPIGIIRIYHNAPLDLNEEDVDSLCILAAQLGVVIEANGLRNFVDQIKMAIESLPPRIRGH